jgi:hypothetical protein
MVLRKVGVSLMAVSPKGTGCLKTSAVSTVVGGKLTPIWQ